MLKFVTAALVLALPAIADNFSEVTALVGSSCGPLTDTGVSFASVSLPTCFTNGFVSYGSTEAQVGVGLDGIGVSMGAVAEGIYGVVTRVTVSWSQDFALSGPGAVGTGFVLPTFAEPASCEVLVFLENSCPVEITISGEQFQFNDISLGGVPPAPPIPVTFGNVFNATITAKQECDSADQIGCGDTVLYLDSLEFTDANGNPLPGVTLQPVPEPVSLILLATAILGIGSALGGTRAARRNH